MELYFYTSRLDVAATSLADLTSLITALADESDPTNAATIDNVTGKIPPLVQSDTGEPLTLKFYDDASTPAAWAADSGVSLAIGLGYQDANQSYVFTSTATTEIVSTYRTATLALNTARLQSELSKWLGMSGSNSRCRPRFYLHLRKTTSGVSETVALLPVRVLPGVLSNPVVDDQPTQYITNAELTAAIAALGTVYQPLDSDLTSIAALTTQSAGRSLLTLAAVPSGALVGTTDTQTLTNKDLSAASNTYRAASETVTGAVELATDAEVVAGTDSARVISPLGLAARIPMRGLLLDGSDYANSATTADAVEAILYETFSRNRVAATTFAVGTDTALTALDLGSGSFIAHDLNTGSAITIAAVNDYLPDNAASANDIYLVSNSSADTDVDVQVRVLNISANLAAQVLARYSKTARSGYAARYISSGAALEIGKWTAGSYSVLATKSVTAYNSSTLVTLRAVGTTLTATVTNGSIADSLTTTDATYTAGYSGFRLGNVSPWIVGFAASPRPAAITSLAIDAAQLDKFGWRVNGSTYVGTQNTGDALTFSFDGPWAALTLNNPALISGYFGATFDGGKTWQVQRLQGGGAITVPIYYRAASTAVKKCSVVFLGNNSTTDNWTTPDNEMRVTAVHVADGSSLYTPRLPSQKWVVVGDSISRGRSLTAGPYFQGNAAASWPWLIAKQFGAQMDFIAFSGQGAGTAGPGNVPAAYTALPYYSNGVARSPDSTVAQVFVAHGTNDGSLDESTLKSRISSTWAAARILWPNARIVVVLPLGYSANTGSPSALSFRDTRNGWISAAFTTWADSNSKIIDLSTEAFGASMLGPLDGGSNSYTSDLIHPNEATNALMADYIAAQ